MNNVFLKSSSAIRIIKTCSMINRGTNTKCYTGSGAQCQVPRTICSNSFSCGADTGCYTCYRGTQGEMWSWCILDEPSSAACWHAAEIPISFHKAQILSFMQTTWNPSTGKGVHFVYQGDQTKAKFLFWYFNILLIVSTKDTLPSHLSYIKESENPIRII